MRTGSTHPDPRNTALDWVWLYLYFCICMYLTDYPTCIWSKTKRVYVSGSTPSTWFGRMMCSCVLSTILFFMKFPIFFLLRCMSGIKTSPANLNFWVPSRCPGHSEPNPGSSQNSWIGSTLPSPRLHHGSTLSLPLCHGVTRKPPFLITK